MTMKIKAVLVATFAFTLLFLGTGCSSSAAEKLIHDGNEAFARQAFEEAWVDYQAAQNKEPELAEPYYNAANALYRQDKYEEALAQLEQALAVTQDESLAQRSFFNLGNTSFNLQTLEAAVVAYKEALLRNPDDQDAKYNLELALQQQEQQQQQQQQEQEQQQQQDQNGQDEQQQDSAGEGEQDQQQPGEQSQNQGGESEQQSDQQSGEESPADQSEGDQQQEPSQNGEGQQDEQQQNDQAGEQGNQDQPRSGQGQSQSGEQQNNGFTTAPGQRMTAEQARELLAAIAQNSQTLQERLGQMLVVPEPPSGQDW
jgi:tetratricopeptide (TPR) repeat protein